MIEARHLKKSFGPHIVLDGTSLQIERGESIAIIGRSGGGKSVLLKILIGLVAPDSGDVLIDGEHLAGRSERELLRIRKKFGMLFQGAALFDSLTVAENVGFALRRAGNLTEKEISTRVDRELDLVGLLGTGTKKPAELSGGMRKRIGLARALIYRPEIMLYDEPTTGLDPIAAGTIDRLIDRVCEELKVTSVVVTHDMKSAGFVARRILMLHDGAIYAAGTPETIFGSEDPIVRRFVTGDLEASALAPP